MYIHSIHDFEISLKRFPVVENPFMHDLRRFGGVLGVFWPNELIFGHFWPFFDGFGHFRNFQFRRRKKCFDPLLENFDTVILSNHRALYL